MKVLLRARRPGVDPEYIELHIAGGDESVSCMDGARRGRYINLTLEQVADLCNQLNEVCNFMEEKEANYKQWEVN